MCFAILVGRKVMDDDVLMAACVQAAATLLAAQAPSRIKPVNGESCAQEARELYERLTGQPWKGAPLTVPGVTGL
jgi:hypothetical protein